MSDKKGALLEWVKKVCTTIPSNHFLSLSSGECYVDILLHVEPSLPFEPLLQYRMPITPSSDDIASVDRIRLRLKTLVTCIRQYFSKFYKCIVPIDVVDITSLTKLTVFRADYVMEKRKRLLRGHATSPLLFSPLVPGRSAASAMPNDMDESILDHIMTLGAFILYICVHCHNKKSFINDIVELPKETQNFLMKAVKEVQKIIDAAPRVKEKPISSVESPSHQPVELKTSIAPKKPSKLIGIEEDIIPVRSPIVPNLAQAFHEKVLIDRPSDRIKKSKSDIKADIIPVRSPIVPNLAQAFHEKVLIDRPSDRIKKSKSDIKAGSSTLSDHPLSMDESDEYIGSHLHSRQYHSNLSRSYHETGQPSRDIMYSKSQPPSVDYSMGSSLQHIHPSHSYEQENVVGKSAESVSPRVIEDAPSTSVSTVSVSQGMFEDLDEKLRLSEHQKNRLTIDLEMERRHSAAIDRERKSLTELMSNLEIDSRKSETDISNIEKLLQKQKQFTSMTQKQLMDAQIAIGYDVSGSTDDIILLKTTVQKQQELIDDLQKTIKKEEIQRINLEQELERALEQHIAEKSKLEQSNRDLINMIEVEKQTQVFTIAKHKKELEHTKEQHQMDITTVHRKFESEKEYYQSTIKTLAQSKEELNLNISILNDKLSNSEQTLSTTTEDLERTKSKLDETETTLVNTQERLGETEHKLGETEQTLSTTTEDLERTKSKLDETETTLVNTQERLGETEHKLGETEQTLSTTTEDLERTKSKLDETETTLVNTQERLGETEHKLGETEQTLSTTTEDLERTKSKLAETETTLVNTQERLGETEHKLGETEQMLSTTTEDLERTKSKLAETETTLVNTQERLGET
ncbi:hypothetical protein ADUPG1_012939, partial [Aduncisulcus paluster]